MKTFGFDRRRWMQGALALGGLGAMGSVPGCAEEEPPPARGRWWKLALIGDEVMDEQLLWYLGQAGEGLTDVGECLDAASRIVAGDEASWFAAWMDHANRLRAVAERAEEAGHRRSAGEAYLRASNYCRAALIHYPEPADPRLRAATLASADGFAKAMELLGYDARAMRIPYEGTTLPGTFFRAPGTIDRAPTLLLHQGFHAFPEETLWVVAGALRRGYHCATFHGPGQGLALRLQSLPFRHDWERVVTPAVDHVLAQPEVDPDRLILMGLSMGGALAPRAAAFEPRIAVCVANPGVLDWNAAMNRKLGEFPGLLEALRVSPEAFNAAVGGVLRGNAAARWWFRDAMWKHGARSPADLLHLLRDYSNVSVVERIRCRTLVMDGTGENFSVGEARRLYDALQCPKEYMLFDERDTGLLHCQAAALSVASQRLFDWLDENVGRR